MTILQNEAIILLAEDDEGHAELIKRNLRRSGLVNEMIGFPDGQAILDFLFRMGKGPHRKGSAYYVLLLDIRLPKVDGVEVLRQIRDDKELRKLPVIMITTTDDPREIDNCHALGCSSYVVKPVNYEQFTSSIKQLGLFLMVVQVPRIDGRIESESAARYRRED